MANISCTLPAEQIDHRRRAAFIGHVLHFHAGERFEELAREMIGKADARTTRS